MVTHPSNRGRSGSRLRLTSVFILSLLSCAPVLLLAGPVTLSTADRVLLAEYRVIGRQQVPMLIATEPRRTPAAVAKLNALHAQVLGRRDAIGYLFAMVPLHAVASVLRIEGLDAVQVAATSTRGRMDVDSDTSSADETAKRRTKGPAPTSALPADNPYTGEAATQALDFKTRNPTFDGRGVITAFVEPIAPTLETMRGALDSSGRLLPKFAHYKIPLANAAEEAVAEDNRVVVWQQTDRVVPAANGTFTWRGRDYHLPASISSNEIGSIRWRMCRRVYDFPVLKEEYDVLWAENREQVWVIPASARGDFSNAPSVSLRESPAVMAVQPLASRPEQRIIEALLVQTDRHRKWLTLVPTTADHAGMVGTVMAGSGFMNSQADGVAPATQLSIYLSPGPVGAQTFEGHEKILTMLSDPNVDVAQASMALGDTSRSGASIQSIWANRLIAANGKPFAKSAGNHGARLFGPVEFEMAESVFAVGGYTPRSTWRANLGVETAVEHVLASYSGWGPARDGGLKPDFLALTHTLTEGVGMGTWYWDADTGKYNVSGGTSAAAPHGAGHFALLVSAARQTGIAHDAFRLRAAIASTAKFLDGIEARAQGHGLIQVSDAWEALQRAHSWTPPSFEVRAPIVGQEAGPHGPTRSVGRGLFELSGWQPGQTGRRELIVTRTSGKRDANLYTLRWKGHTEVFQSALREVELPLRRAVAIPLDIRVGESGSYSAILDLIDPRSDLVAGSILNTVMVADTLKPEGDGLHYRRKSPRPGISLFYVDVPSGLAALTVSIEKDNGKSSWLATDPTGNLVMLPGYGSELHRPDETQARLDGRHFVYQDPIPGVWQFELRNAEPRSLQQLEAVSDWRRPMPLEVRIQGWTSLDGKAAPASSDLKVEALALGAARESQVELRRGFEPQIFEIQVQPGTTSIDVQIDHADPSSRVGLYVFKVPEGARVATTLTTDHTALVYHDTSLQARKRYRLEAPLPGRYAVAIDPIHIADKTPGASLAVTYRDVIRHPLFGSASLSDWSGDAVVDVGAKPADGRRLHAEIDLLKPVGPARRAVLGRREWWVGWDSNPGPMD